jgi:hypothetical protein
LVCGTFPHSHYRATVPSLSVNFPSIDCPCSDFSRNTERCVLLESGRLRPCSQHRSDHRAPYQQANLPPTLIIKHRTATVRTCRNDMDLAHQLFSELLTVVWSTFQCSSQTYHTSGKPTQVPHSQAFHRTLSICTTVSLLPHHQSHCNTTLRECKPSITHRPSAKIYQDSSIVSSMAIIRASFASRA